MHISESLTQHSPNVNNLVRNCSHPPQSTGVVYTGAHQHRIIAVMSNRLSDTVIEQRMIEWRNLKTQHAVQKKRIEHLVAENVLLKVRIVELEKENMQLRSELADVRYQLSELATIVFKKKRRAQDSIDDDNDTTSGPGTSRTPSSYQRPIPTDAEVTETKYHPLTSTYASIRTKTYFVEDIPLGMNKIVVKHTVEQGYDTERRTWISAVTLPNTRVTLGDNVRVLVATLITIERLSYEQVRMLFLMLFKLHLSDGEIANILEKEAMHLASAESALLTSIRRESSHHMDESRYDILGETRYGWGIIGGTSGDSVYRLGVSRGKGIAEELRGDSDGVLITDDYGAYRILAQHHQLCFAHLIRKFRDLAQHEGFTDTQKEDVVRIYRTIKDIYRCVVSACSAPDSQQHRAGLEERFATVATIAPTDPRPLVRLKTTLMKNISSYLTCLSFPMIALTNNLAERALRHIVLKRKNSFGCKSDKGARTLSTLLSVLLSLYRRDPMTYVEKYMELRRV